MRSGRPFQLRYKCPVDGCQKRISVGSRDGGEALQLKAELESRVAWSFGISHRGGSSSGTSYPVRQVYTQIIEKIETKAKSEFENIIRERDLDARLAELEDVLADAEARRGKGDKSGGGMHSLPPEQLLLATLTGEMEEQKLTVLEM